MAKRYLIIPEEPEALAARIRDARYKRDFWFDAVLNRRWLLGDAKRRYPPHPDELAACRRDLRNARRNRNEWQDRFEYYQAAENALAVKREREREHAKDVAACEAANAKRARKALRNRESIDRDHARLAARSPGYAEHLARVRHDWTVADTSTDQEYDDATVPTWRNQP